MHRALLLSLAFLGILVILGSLVKLGKLFILITPNLFPHFVSAAKWGFFLKKIIKILSLSAFLCYICKGEMEVPK